MKNIDKVRRCYNDGADLYDNRYKGITGEYFKLAEWDYISNLVDFTDKTILDLSTGTGRCVFLAKDKIKKAVGIDISEKMINIAKSKITDHERISFYVMNAKETSFGNDTFDIVLSIDMFEYIIKGEK